MQKLTKEQADKILPIGKGRNTQVSAAVKYLQIGEGLVITRKDWKTKTPPYNTISYIERTTKRKYRKGRMPDGTGWFVQRME